MSSGAANSTDGTPRRDRAAIAAQACSTCRNRKTKCDEQRPKCGLCQRLDVECVYREPQPTKKDKTLVFVLDSLLRIERKLEVIAPSPTAGSSGPDTTMANHLGSESDTSPLPIDALPVPDKEGSHHRQRSFSEAQLEHRQLTVPHSTFLWPSIYILLTDSGIPAAADIPHLLQDGTAWFIRRAVSLPKFELPSHISLATYSAPGTGPDHRQHVRVVFPGLDLPRVHQYCEAYFGTFNVLNSILNRDQFFNDVVEPVMRDGFTDNHIDNVLLLLVLALGHLAIEGVSGRAVSTVNGKPSGFRGGTLAVPPGIEFFNEARKRVGFVSMKVSLENVQVMLLQATYYAAYARHLEFWRANTDASMTIQVIIKCGKIDWDSTYGDLVKRAYWACVVGEDFYHLDMDLPQSGIRDLEDLVPRTFPRDLVPVGSGLSFSEYHFLAMVTLHRLISSINQSVHDFHEPTDPGSFDDDGPPTRVVQELSRQLESWRSLLPPILQWTDSDRLGYPNVEPWIHETKEPLFSPDMGASPTSHELNLDIVIAHLRTRFYYGRFMLYRPFVYKALHFPERMDEEDCLCCAHAIKAALLWPMCLAPPNSKKRLVPHLFAWTQNFISILLILRITSESQCLRDICEKHINRDDFRQSVTLMLDWIQDVRQVDTIADWSWGILEPLFSGWGGLSVT